MMPDPRATRPMRCASHGTHLSNRPDVTDPMEAAR